MFSKGESIEVAISHEKEVLEGGVMPQLIKMYTQPNAEKRNSETTPEELPIQRKGPWRWENIEGVRKQNQEKSLRIPDLKAFNPTITSPPADLHTYPQENRTTLAQRLHAPMTQPRTLDALYPQRVPLRTKRSVRCRQCLDNGAPNILIKAQINPLKGDSSVRMNVGSWFKKKSLAYDNIPRIIALRLELGTEEFLVLLLTNPLEQAMKVEVLLENNESEEEKSFKVAVDEYDELAEIDFQLERKVQLKRTGEDSDYVLGRWRNKAAIRIRWQDILDRARGEREVEDEEAKDSRQYSTQFTCKVSLPDDQEMRHFAFMVSW